MEILHQTIKRGKDSSLAEVHIDGIFECFVLEDQVVKEKVYGEAAIPAGHYEIKLKTRGSTMHVAYKNRFPDFHVGMLEITGIPGYGNVYYHIGNKDDDTLGCPLTGTKWAEKNGEYIIPAGSSEPAYKAFYKKVAAELSAGRKVFVSVVR